MASRFPHKYPHVLLLAALAAGIAGSGWCAWISEEALLYFLLVTGGGLVAAIAARLSPAIVLSVAALFISGTGVYRSHSPEVPAGIAGETLSLGGRCESVFALPGRYLIRSGNLRVLLQTRDSTPIQPGDSVAFAGRVYPLVSKRYFHDFDYDSYLRHQGIQARAYTDSVNITGHSDNFLSLCHASREHLVRKIRRLLPDTLTSSLLEALCLGYREDLHPSTEELFRSTGTVHLLAISGLHMGALYLLLVFALNAIGIRGPKSRLIIIPLLWFIACLTGLSPSACRAALILSLLLAGKAFKQDYQPINAVAASAFLSLLVNPHLLYSVSFQMSYAAYTGIILFYPRLNRFRKRLPALPGKVYGMLCLSLTAQVMTVPLTAYYFHSINVNGILINLLAIPLATSLLYGGVLLLVLPGAVGAFIAPAVTLINRGLFFSLEQFQAYSYNLTQVYPTGIHVLLAYGLLLSSAAYLERRSPTAIRWTGGLALVLALYQSGWEYSRSHRQEVVVFHYHDRSAILLNQHGHYSFLKHPGQEGDEPLPHYIHANGLRPIPAAEGFLNRNTRFLENRLYADRDTIQIADREHPSTSTPGILIVTENTFPPGKTNGPIPRHIILDKTNSPRCRGQWVAYCKRHGISCSSTETEGSIRIPLRAGNP